MSKSNAELVLAPPLAKKLSSVLLVSTAAFTDLTPKQQTALVNTAGGLPIEFVPNFKELSNRKALRDKLLAGQNVDRELEFNGIELSDEEQRVLSLITPILEKIGGGMCAYSWLPEQDFSSTISFGNYYNTPTVKRNGHFIGLKSAKTIWLKASNYWAGGEKPKDTRAATDGNYSANRSVSYKSDSVIIGCQTISRAELEYVARIKNWEPNA